MSVLEVLGKTAAFAVSAAIFIVCGILVLTGSHAGNDYLNSALGFTLVGIGGITAGFGALSIGGIVLDERARRAEAKLHVAPRPGSPALPPAWGMGNIGRIEGGKPVSESKGGSRVMSVAVNNLDAPLIVGLLLVWTAVALFLFAPK